jgi:hypothetical protein
MLSLGMSPPKVGANRYFTPAPKSVIDKGKALRDANGAINSATANGAKRVPDSVQPAKKPNSFSAYGKR